MRVKLLLFGDVLNVDCNRIDIQYIAKSRLKG
jgi:hypothetical protein